MVWGGIDGWEGFFFFLVLLGRSDRAPVYAFALSPMKATPRCNSCRNKTQVVSQEVTGNRAGFSIHSALIPVVRATAIHEF